MCLSENNKICLKPKTYIGELDIAVESDEDASAQKVWGEHGCCTDKLIGYGHII